MSDELFTMFIQRNKIYKTERGTLEARIMNPTPTASKRTARTTVPVWQQRLNHHTRGDQPSAPGAARPLATPMNSRGRTHVRQSVQSTSTQPPQPSPRRRQASHLQPYGALKHQASKRQEKNPNRVFCCCSNLSESSALRTNKSESRGGRRLAPSPYFLKY